MVLDHLDPFMTITEREGVGALVPVIDLHELKNVHDEVFNFSHEAVVDHSSSSDLPAV